MKTTFLPALALTLAILIVSRTTWAASPPGLSEEGSSLETAPAASLASADLQPGPAKVAGSNVNVRSKATIKSEVITQLQDGDEVFVEEVILRTDARGQDPARWAKISYPASAAPWVHSLYIDEAGSTVKPRKLNVRSGPGENFTIVNTLRAGDVVKPLARRGDWIQIAAPEGTTAYIAAKLLRQEPPPETEVATAETAVVETAVVETQPEVAEGTEATEPEMVAVVETDVVEGATGVVDNATGEEPLGLEQLPEMETIVDEPPLPRVVQREGIVRANTSIQAPSDYKLVNPENNRFVNYLWTTSTNLDLGRYVGLHIIAAGEESLDERWPGKPVLTLKRIVVVE